MKTIKAFGIIVATCVHIVSYGAANQTSTSISQTVGIQVVTVLTPRAVAKERVLTVLTPKAAIPVVVMQTTPPVYNAISPTHRSDLRNPFPHMVGFWPRVSASANSSDAKQ